MNGKLLKIFFPCIAILCLLTSANGYADYPKVVIYITDGQSEKPVAQTSDETSCKTLANILNVGAKAQKANVSFYCKGPTLKV